MTRQGGGGRGRNNMSEINGPGMTLVKPDPRPEKVKLSRKGRPDGEGTSHGKTQRENNIFHLHFEKSAGR